MAGFDRSVPPGGEGKITLKINTKNYQGKIRKGAKVLTNDLKNSSLSLTIAATIKTSISLSTRGVNLRGLSDRKITKTVTIRANENVPLKLEQIKYDLSEKIPYKIEEIEDGKVFKLFFNTIPGITKSCRGILKLKTNYIDKPVITIRVNARLSKKKV